MDFPQSFRTECGPLTPEFQTLASRTVRERGKKKEILLFKPASLCHLLQQPRESDPEFLLLSLSLLLISTRMKHSLLSVIPLAFFI